MRYISCIYHVEVLCLGNKGYGMITVTMRKIDVT